MKHEQSIVEDILDNNLECDLLFPSSDFDSDTNASLGAEQVPDNEEELLSKIEWEEIPLRITKKNIQLPIVDLQIAIDKKNEQKIDKKNILSF